MIPKPTLDKEIPNNPITTAAIPKLNHIDQLRGLAILLVIVVHVLHSQSNIHPLLAIAGNFGTIGVQLFFFLSAYTLCLSYINRKDPSIVNFYIRRFFRIAPLYLLGILIYYLFSGLIPEDLSVALPQRESYTLSNVLFNIFFIHGFVPAANNTIVPGGWSIGTEMIFYLIFPFIFYLYSKLKANGTLLLMPLLLFAVSNLFSFIVLHYNEKAFSDPFYYYFIINQLPVFLVGISYFFLERRGYFHITRMTCLILFCIFFLTSFVIMVKLHNNISLSIFIAAISFSFLFRYFKESQVKIFFLARIGQLSFSIYLFHFLFAGPLSLIIANYLSGKLSSYIVFGVCFIITLVLSAMIAAISERWIETPGINLGKILIKKRMQQ